ncbi:hypothetical protein B9P99_01585 [Candidatus Marsarchaeota G1 archaeon OSP_B]|jgi:DNA-binding Lrp family transcriptional regulator|uniref:HTH asnC-type domain-containing protein n=1 Tax=Candidatus Marsarchaeota G1 archaeon OSP_B TaxID=1978153 RepID=A0A2R6B7G8_9ARCH|nr:MAG: hypothetical protein B9P99_01585 [Candidatus Marsarchaeota G1 archaeon OSP_B]
MIQDMDQHDIQILTQLSQNARLSSEKIGRSIGLTGNAVANRIKKLVREGVIEGFRMIPKFENLEISTYAFYLENKRHSVMCGKIEELFDLPYFYTAIVCIEGSLLVFTLANSIKQAQIQERQILSILNEFEVKRRFHAEYTSIENRRTLTRLDLRIMLTLLEEPRLPVSELSKKLGVSARTVNRRLSKLIEGRDVKFTLKLQPSKIKDFIPYYLFVNLGRSSYNGTKIKLIERFKDYSIWYANFGEDKLMLSVCRRDLSEIERDLKAVERMVGCENYLSIFPSKIVYNDAPVKSALQALYEKPPIRQISVSG